MKEIITKCINCGNSTWLGLWEGHSLDYSSEKIYMIKSCKICGLVRTFLDPVEEDLSIYYQKEPYHYRKSFFQLIKDSIFNCFEKNKLRKISKLAHERNLLDIGSGKGRFVIAARKSKWNAYGYEPYRKAHTDFRYRQIIFNGSLGKLPLKKKSIDVITMFHVLEHTINPLQTIQYSKKYLKNDGILIISIPNIESFLAKISKGLWYHLDLPRHLWHFSSRTLNKLLLLEGFKIVDLTYFSYYQNIMGLWMTIGNLLGCAYNYPWNLVRLNRDMIKNTSIFQLSYSTIIHAILFLLLPFMFLMTSVLSVLKKGDTIEVVATYKESTTA